MKLLRQTVRMAGMVALLGGVMPSQGQTPYNAADRDAAARSAYARGDTARAAAVLNEAVRVNPFDPVALNNLAVNYAAQGDYQNAVALLERAQRLAPNRPDIVNNLANLKAWMAQDSQFALGTRGAPQALNFPRAEDSPPELPPLWGGPAALAPQQVPAARSAVTVPQYPTGQAPAYPQAAQQQYAQPPAYAQPQAAYTPPPIYTQPQAAPAPAASALRPVATSARRQSVITERASDTMPRKKKKRPVAVDCPVP